MTGDVVPGSTSMGDTRRTARIWALDAARVLLLPMLSHLFEPGEDLVTKAAIWALVRGNAMLHVHVHVVVLELKEFDLACWTLTGSAARSFECNWVQGSVVRRLADWYTLVGSDGERGRRRKG